MEITLLRGRHGYRFGLDDEPTMCAMEFCAYLAGGKHTDWPDCVDSCLTWVAIEMNDAFDTATRQHLKRYVPRMIGTSCDGQNETRVDLLREWCWSHRTTCIGNYYRTTPDHVAFADAIKRDPVAAFELLDSLIDPGGIHDLERKEELVAF